MLINCMGKSFNNVYVHKIIMIYTLNTFYFCQFYFNKAIKID